MYKLNVWKNGNADIEMTTLSFDSYDKFVKGYWAAWEDRQVRMLEVSSNLDVE